MKGNIPFEEECAGLIESLLEMLNFLETEFLRVAIDRGLYQEDLPGAITSLAIPAIDSLKAMLLLCQYDDFQNADVMLRRFEEYFTVMAYFALVDDGTVLHRWFQMPGFIIREKNYKIRSVVAERTKGFFTRNPFYDFKGNFDYMSKESVHATWQSTKTALVHAAGRYSALNPGTPSRDGLAVTLHQARSVMLLGVVGPSASRFFEFLEKSVFLVPELAGVSPGSDCFKRMDEDIFRWAIQVQPLVEQMENQL